MSVASGGYYLAASRSPLAKPIFSKEPISHFSVSKNVTKPRSEFYFSFLQRFYKGIQEDVCPGFWYVTMFEHLAGFLSDTVALATANRVSATCPTNAVGMFSRGFSFKITSVILKIA